MKIAQARKLLTEDIGRMTLEQLQKHRVKLTDAWRESRAEYGMGQAAMDGFYRQTGEDITEYTPTDLWLTQNLSHRLDETIERELELLSDHNSKAYPDDGETDEADLNQKRIDAIESNPSWRAIY